MATVKINADSGGGTVALKGPATTTGDAAVELTLPVDDGTANQYLKTDGSGALSWATVASPVTALNNATANELVTVGSTTTELDAESGLTFDGTHLSITDGDLKIATSGHGIDFSAASGSASGSASAILDDYEEGTWTPAFGGTSSAPTLSGYESQTGGWYVKVGRLVTCWFFIYGQTVNSDGGGTLTMTGLPFSASAANDGGEGVATTGWMKVGTECNADDKWAYWRNTGGTDYLKAQSRELSDGSQNNPTQADSLPNSALSVGYISYRTNSV